MEDGYDNSFIKRIDSWLGGYEQNSNTVKETEVYDMIISIIRMPATVCL